MQAPERAVTPPSRVDQSDPERSHLRLVRQRVDLPGRLGALAQPARLVSPALTVGAVENVFKEFSDVRSLVVDCSPPRLLNRSSFFQSLAGRLGFGRPLLLNRSILVMPFDDVPVLGAEITLEDAAIVLSSHDRVNILDDLLVRSADSSLATVSVSELFHVVARRAAAALEEISSAERRYRALVERANDGVVVVDGAGVLTYATPVAATLLGASRAADVVGSSPIDQAHPDDVEALRLAWERSSVGETVTCEARLRDRHGRWRVLEFVMRNLLDDAAIGGVVVNFRDVTERRELQEQMHRSARCDALTDLANRAHVTEHVQERLHTTGHQRHPLSIVFVDLDHFKLVNDTYGHLYGDRLLVEVARRLREVAPNALVGRWGGDEFIIVVEVGMAEARDLARSVVGCFDAPVDLGGTQVSSTASVGVATADDVDDVSELVRLADAAMYVAKRDGGARVVAWTPSLHDPQVRHQLAVDLALAIDREQISIHLQPIVALPGREVTGVEALARWTHPSRGPVSPAEFVALAEQEHLVGGLGRSVLRQTCSVLAGWRAEGRSPITASINLSPRQLHEVDLVDDLALGLADYDLSPSSICVEITESALISDFDAARRVLRRVRALGVKVALDDFGVGYSSLGYLAELPIDVIKIDRIFVSRLCRSSTDEVLMRGVVQLAHALGLRVVAEGVETEQQLERLLAIGADSVQGYLTCPPMSVDALSLDRIATRGLHWGVRTASDSTTSDSRSWVATPAITSTAPSRS
jgi:diguanylate cyclase (GGDEF)-like protein/PAS domain S-box-containing protein